MHLKTYQQNALELLDRPEMDQTTFRLSLLRAVEQAKEGKPVTRNAKAWLKAAFEKNSAPLVTAHDIEAQVTGGQGAESSQPTSPQADQLAPATRPEEDEIFQQYMAADEAQRREIDRLAEEKMETMQAVLAQVGPDKHQSILVQARIEAARVVLGGAESSEGEGGDDSVAKGE